jgi:hypothetical protein
MGSCGNNRFTNNVRKVGSDYKMHRHSGYKKRRPGEKTAANAEEAAEATDDEADTD